MKTKQCTECKHQNVHNVLGDPLCKKGHQPRFYKPKSGLTGNWGWKRKCGDFESAK